MENQPKISIVEAFILIAGALLIDIVPIVCLFIGLPDFFIPGIISFVSVFYLKMKGVSIVRDVAVSIAELIPYVSALPMKTAVMIMTIWIDRHPTGALAQAARQAEAAVKVKRGRAGAAPRAATPGIKSPIGSIPAPSAPQIALAKAPTQSFKRAA